MLSQQAHGLRNKLCRTRHQGYRTPWSSFSTSCRRNGYDSTIQNLKIGAHTRVIFQGFTGKQATVNAKESIEWGTNVVGGVKPNGSGEHLGLPVLPSVRAAMEQLKPDATGIYVAAHQATAAIEEAIEAEVPLIVAVAEHIPLHDMMRVSCHSTLLPGGYWLIRVDTFHAAIAIQVTAYRCQRTGNHLSYWSVQNRVPTIADLLPWPHWYRGKIWNSLI